MVTNLKNSRVLITTGPTWVKIDSVRVISNTATGKTGILLAEKLTRLGAKVTLLLGPVGTSNLNKKIRVIRFQFFDELKNLLEKELKTRKYDLAIHSAAVSDYRSLAKKGKISSGLKELKIKLTPTPKIINIFKKLRPSISLVGFKFEPEASRIKLIKEARHLISKTKADFIVANTFKKEGYLAYLVMNNKESTPIFSRKDMVDQLIEVIGKS